MDSHARERALRRLRALALMIIEDTRRDGRTVQPDEIAHRTLQGYGGSLHEAVVGGSLHDEIVRYVLELLEGD